MPVSVINTRTDGSITISMRLDPCHRNGHVAALQVGNPMKSEYAAPGGVPPVVIYQSFCRMKKAGNTNCCTCWLVPGSLCVVNTWYTACSIVGKHAQPVKCTHTNVQDTNVLAKTYRNSHSVSSSHIPLHPFSNLAQAIPRFNNNIYRPGGRSSCMQYDLAWT